MNREALWHKIPLFTNTTTLDTWVTAIYFTENCYTWSQYLTTFSGLDYNLS